MDPKDVSLKKNSPPKLFPPKRFLIQKRFSPKKFVPKKNVVQKNFVPQKNLGPKKVSTEKICPMIMDSKNKGPKIISPKNMWITKNNIPILVTKFVCQNLVSNSWDTTYMDKCHLESSHLLKIVPGTYILVKIESVTPEIFLIQWRNVVGTNVVWKNVAVTVGICSRCSQNPMFRVWSKLSE